MFSISYTTDVHALHVWTLDLPFVPQNGEESIADQDGQTKTPDQGDGVEEVGVTRPGIDPKVVKCWAQKRRVQKDGGRDEGVSRHCKGQYGSFRQ